jgi:hypothetical protein
LLLGLVFGGLGLFLVAGIGLAAYCIIAGSDSPAVAVREEGPDEGTSVAPILHPPEKQGAPVPAPPVPDAEPAEPEPVPPPPAADQEPPPPAPPPPPPKPVVTKSQPVLINEAIDHGVSFLKAQERNGKWRAAGPHAVGYTALPVLTLLECGVAKDDPAVQRAATQVRFQSGNLTMTYDLALAILFLDRLGETKDRSLIQQLASRLIAGQNERGGWTYNCRLLSQQENYQLLTFLRQYRPQPLPTGLASDGPTLLNPIGAGKPATLPQGIAGDQVASLPTAIPGATGPSGRKDSASSGSQTVLIKPFAPGSDEAPKPARPAAGKKAQKPEPKNPPILRVDKLLPSVRSLPVISGAPPAAKNAKGPRPNVDDNSNSQFAMLALWVARRHDVPVERTMTLVHTRYHLSQHPDGGWGYHTIWGKAGAKAQKNEWGLGTRPSMTCVGLLGLAMGHGSAQEMRAAAKNPAKKAKEPRVTPASAMEDPAIQRGLKKLGTYVGNPTGVKTVRLQDLYALWSVERVAVLYNLKTIGGKDWYGWAAEMLLANQHPDGHWHSGQYPGSNPTTDTCFALLILKRSNLVQDLSESLGTFITITDPDVAGRPGGNKK